MSPQRAQPPPQPPLAEIARQWGRIGCIGFGGPPAHVALFRDLCVARWGWLSGEQFERALAAANLLPGPASTQLAIYCAWRLRGRVGAVVGGLCFITPGLAMILALSAAFLSGSPPSWLRGAGSGAGGAVAAVAVRAGLGVAAPIHARARATATRAGLARMLAYALAGAAGAALAGPWLVLVLIACGLLELWTRARRAGSGDGGRASGAASALALAALAALSSAPHAARAAWAPMSARAATATARVAAAGARLAPGAARAASTADPGGTIALVWTALKVGGLAFGGGFVIVPLMESDAVSTYHWMTHAQFLNAVALGQVTPGPVTQTVAAVGYSAAGLAGGLLAALVAFAPSFAFVLLGGRGFERLRADAGAAAFLDGAAPAAAGAIIGAAIPLTAALSESWQYAVLATAAVALLALRRGIVSTLLVAAGAGVLAALVGAPVPR